MDTIDTFISQTVIGHEQEDEWNYFFGSGYTCPRQMMYGAEDKQAKITTSFYTRYRRSVNKAVSKTIQQTWARQGLLWGDWRCKDTSCGVFYPNCRLEGGICIRCGSPAYYTEKELSDPETGRSGRCNAVVYVPAHDGYLIFKLKSRNTNIILTAKEPYPSEIQQASTVATLLAKQKLLRVVGRVVLWVGTPKPRPFKHWYYDGLGEDLVEDQIKLKQNVDKMIAAGRSSEIIGRCSDPREAQNCPFIEKCFGEQE